jgi:anti-repressor protein
MVDLIKIEDRVFGGGEAIKTVDARELHEFLEVGKRFTDWLKARIEQYNFIKGQDYITNLASQNGEASLHGGQNRVDVFVTVDMAKELAMVERTAKGKEARQYFIECERRAKAAVSPAVMLNDPVWLRAALQGYTEKVIELEAKVEKQAAIVEEQAPKARFHDAVAKAINCHTIQEVGKITGIGPNNMFKFMRRHGLLMKNNLPYQRFIDSGVLKVIEKQYMDKHHESIIYSQTLVTGKGLIYIQKLADKSSKMPWLDLE